MVEASARWIAHGEARLPPGLVVSFQRFAWPEGGVIARVPSSLGALPVGIGQPRDLVLPLAIDECFWIGWSRTPGVSTLEVAVTVELQDGVVVDAVTSAPFDEARPGAIRVPDWPRLPGIRRPDGQFDVFLRETRHDEGRPCRRMRLQIARAGPQARGTADDERPTEPFSVAIRLLDYVTFTAESGLPSPAPLDANAGYEGWRLP